MNYCNFGHFSSPTDNAPPHNHATLLYHIFICRALENNFAQGLLDQQHALQVRPGDKETYLDHSCGLANAHRMLCDERPAIRDVLKYLCVPEKRPFEWPASALS